MIACGQQLFAVVVGGTADGGGALTVSVSPPVRSPINIGTAVTWDRPSGSFVTREPVYVPYEPARAPSFAVELVEVF